MVISSPQYGKIEPFYPIFPFAESMTKVFCWLFLWGFNKKHQLFYDTILVCNLCSLKSKYIKSAFLCKWNSTFYMPCLFSWLCYSMWLFHLHSAVKIQPFSLVFPLAGSTAKAFFWLSLWNFKKKTSTIFYNTAF